MFPGFYNHARLPLVTSVCGSNIDVLYSMFIKSCQDVPGEESTWSWEKSLPRNVMHWRVLSIPCDDTSSLRSGIVAQLQLCHWNSAWKVKGFCRSWRGLKEIVWLCASDQWPILEMSLPSSACEGTSRLVTSRREKPSLSGCVSGVSHARCFISSLHCITLTYLIFIFGRHRRWCKCTWEFAMKSGVCLFFTPFALWNWEFKRLFARQWCSRVLLSKADHCI
jgi:hypothetical protein